MSICFIWAAFYSADASTENDLKEMNLKGNVKSVRQTTYKAVKIGDNVEKGGRKLERKSDLDFFILFNANGNKSEQYLFKADSSLDRKLIYQYDDKGSTTQEDRYDADGTLTHKTAFSYTYDSKGKVTERIRTADGRSYTYTSKYDDKGNIIEWDADGKPESAYKYDGNGKVIEVAYYKADGGADWRYTYTYDSNGNKYEETWYQSGTKFVMKYLWKYDDKGNVVGCVWVDSKNKSRKQFQWSYEYDKHGNWTKQIEYRKDKPVFVTERQLAYF